MWGKFVEQGHTTDDNMVHALACWIPKVTNTHSQYVIHIAFPQQHWLHERASILRYSYIACLVCIVIVYCIVVIRHCGDGHGGDQNMLVKTLTDIAGT